MRAFRSTALEGTQLAKATVGTIRLHLMKEVVCTRSEQEQGIGENRRIHAKNDPECQNRSGLSAIARNLREAYEKCGLAQRQDRTHGPSATRMCCMHSRIPLGTMDQNSQLGQRQLLMTTYRHLLTNGAGRYPVWFTQNEPA